MDVQRLKGYADRIKKDSEDVSRTIVARITGVTFDNRQELLAGVTVETELRFERDRRNEYDFYAVKVMAYLETLASWEHVGFIPRPMSRTISNALDKGQGFNVFVHRLKGGFECEHTGEFLNRGLEVRITPDNVVSEGEV